MIKSVLALYGGAVLIFCTLCVISWAVVKEEKTKTKKKKKLTARLKEKLEEKWKEWLALILTCLLLIYIPLWLNGIITYGWYEVLCVRRSVMRPEDWISFLGSYLGAVGTIIIGALAYNQNKQINNQNKQIQDLQEKITMYQTKPFMQFMDGDIEIHGDEKHRSLNRDRYGKIYYSLYGRKLEESERQELFVYIEIPFSANNIVPINRIVLDGFVWQIASECYTLRIDDENKELPVGNALRFLISGNDVKRSGMCEDWSDGDFIEWLIMHQNYYAHGTTGFDKSELIIEFSVYNQIESVQKYRLSYYINTERDTEEIKLINPHIYMENTERENEANGK